MCWSSRHIATTATACPIPTPRTARAPRVVPPHHNSRSKDEIQAVRDAHDPINVAVTKLTAAGIVTEADVKARLMM